MKEGFTHFSQDNHASIILENYIPTACVAASRIVILMFIFHIFSVVCMIVFDDVFGDMYHCF